MGALFRDIRYGARSLLRSPGFSLVVVATLALGIGANTAIFSVVDAVLLERLPYHESERLVTVWQDVSRQGGPVREWLNYPTMEDVRDEPGLMEAISVWGGWTPTLTGAQEPEVLQAAEVSHGMFSEVLRVRPVLGHDQRPAVCIVLDLVRLVRAGLQAHQVAGLRPCGHGEGSLPGTAR